jgi:hypothetical protein
MTAISNRPINIKPVVTPVAPAANAPKPVATAAPAPLPVNTEGVFGAAPNTAIDAVLWGFNLGKIATIPVIGTIITTSIKSGFGLQNLAWFVVPGAIRNVQAVAGGKESVGRAVGNVATETTFGVVKGIISGVAVQAVSVAVAPLLGLITIPAAILPFAGIAIGLGTMFLAYQVMNRVVKATGMDQKMADGITNLLGGDLKPAPAAK